MLQKYKYAFIVGINIFLLGLLILAGHAKLYAAESMIASEVEVEQRLSANTDIPTSSMTLPFPESEGGSEQSSREQHPDGLKDFEEQYPDIFFLHGSPQENRVALTFDDGPDARFTPQVLDVLSKYGVQATFFVMGARAAALPELTERIHQEGHAVGSHGYWHPDFTKESVERLQREVIQTEEALEGIIGIRPQLFRAPYGAVNGEMIEALGEMDYTVIGWSVDSLDWMEPEPEQIVANVVGNIHPGAIILMHDGGDWTQDLTGTVEALDEMIPQLQEEGYEFVTVPELLDIPESK